MIGVSVRTNRVDFAKAAGPKSRPVERAKYRSFSHAGGSVRKAAIESIKFGGKGRRSTTRTVNGQKKRIVRHRASPPGTPPFYHTTKQYVRRGVLFSATKDNVIIGPTASRYGQSMEAHEFGVPYKGQLYPARPFMAPALKANLSRFHESWKGSIGN